MPFFEPLPPPPPEPAPDQPTGWRPPVWDRPSEALLGAPVDIAILLGKNERVAIVIDTVRAYPNGFEFAPAILHNPQTVASSSATRSWATPAALAAPESGSSSRTEPKPAWMVRVSASRAPERAGRCW